MFFDGGKVHEKSGIWPASVKTYKAKRLISHSYDLCAFLSVSSSYSNMMKLCSNCSREDRDFLLENSLPALPFPPLCFDAHGGVP